jgi:hypothetical protein
MLLKRVYHKKEGKARTLNSKYEARNPKQTQMFKKQNTKRESPVLDFRILSFEFVSDFALRISSFKKAPYSAFLVYFFASLCAVCFRQTEQCLFGVSFFSTLFLFLVDM